MPPGFSIVVPTYNRPELLARALASIQRQTIQDWECVVVDDGSEHAPTLPDDPRIRLVRQANTGCAAARNRGVAESTGEFLTFLDDDDWWLPSRLDVAARGLQEAPITVAWARFEDDPEHTSGRILSGFVGDTILDATTPPLDATALRRNAWIPLNESYRASEDVEWWLRISRAQPVSTIEETVAIVGHHDGVRIHHGTDARIHSSRRLLEEHSAYFATHPRAEAFRWRRIARMSALQGDRRKGAAAAVRALVVDPSVGSVRGLVSTARAMFMR